MKFTLSRLFDFLETDATINQITDALNNLGLEVESVNDPNETLGAFTVGKIISAEKHPSADRLQICQVETFEGTKQIICGAPNARQGLNVCVSLPNMYIPGLDITIKKGKIRDVESHGMLCSLGELGIEAPETDGILEIADTAKVGEKIIDILNLNDPVIEISVTPNRPDALGVYGIAQDLAAFGIGTLKPLEIPEIQGTFTSPITVDVQHPQSCPHFVGYYIKNVKITQSPDYIKHFLKSVGCKSINAPVDITNYLAYSFARPLHVFDADKIGTKISARLADSSETIEALDEGTYQLQETDIVIADEHSPQAIAGIMGSMKSGVYDDTVNIFLESAYFDPDYVAATGRRLNILSDARYRFERGVNPAFTENGAKIAAKMIIDLCGGDISNIVIAGKPALPDMAFQLSHDAVLKLTGIEIDFVKQEKILRSLGFTVINQGKKLICVPPASRPDIKGQADLIEEIIRIYGINNVTPIALPEPIIKQNALTPAQKRIQTVRHFAANHGLLEAITYSFTEELKAKLFAHNTPLLNLENPISIDLSTMRPSLLCGLFSAISHNHARGFKNNALFEIGRVFHGTNDDQQPQQMAVLKTGSASNGHWLKPIEEYSIYDIKADLLALLKNLGAPISGLMIKPNAPDYYHPNRSGCVMLGKMVYGYFGEIHPKIANAYDLVGRPVACEILIDSISMPKVKKSTALPKANLYNLQSVSRDFAFVLNHAITADTLLKAVRKGEKKLISDIDIFDVFTGGNLQENEKSIALRVTLQPTDKSLTDVELTDIMDNIIAEVRAIGGILR
ncbi:MAG: phenylalanyl-tRNA synthetase beta chain [Alphaproteobacteria bacterium]|jgi:phenylalanyl-tRNA synthetase beta chain